MMHVAIRIVELLLDWLGMTRAERLIMVGGLMILAFALYAGKQFATQPVYATLYLLLGASFCVLLTTDNDTTRTAAAVGLGAVIVVLFAWYYAVDLQRQRRTRGAAHRR
jgi:hypothetical protein